MDTSKLMAAAGKILADDLAEADQKAREGITRETFKVGVPISEGNRYAWHEAPVQDSGGRTHSAGLTKEQAIKLAGQRGIVYHIFETKKRIK